MDRKHFEELANKALESLPEPFRLRLENIAIVIEDSPPREPGPGTLLLGLFSGVPQTRKSVMSADPPDYVILYQKNIEAVSRDEAQIASQIRETLLHEIGHYFGLSEKELREAF